MSRPVVEPADDPHADQIAEVVAALEATRTYRKRARSVAYCAHGCAVGYLVQRPDVGRWLVGRSVVELDPIASAPDRSGDGLPIVRDGGPYVVVTRPEAIPGGLVATCKHATLAVVADGLTVSAVEVAPPPEVVADGLDGLDVRAVVDEYRRR